MMEHFTTLADLFERSVATYARREFLGTKKAGQWHWITFADFKRQVDACRAGLKQAGISAGDRVAIVANNRVEWAVAAFASASLAAVFVPMYQAQGVEEWTFILRDSATKLVFAATPKIYDELSAARAELPSLTRVIGLDLDETHADSWEQLLRAGARTPLPVVHPKPSDIASFIYTSGTTGKPKGVVLTHRNFCANVNSVSDLFGLTQEDRSLCFLPWAHAFGQTGELYLFMGLGASMALNDDLPNLVGNLSEVRPTVLVAVPRIFNRIYDGVHKQMRGKPALIQKLFAAGIRHGTARAKAQELGAVDRATLALADKLIFRKVRGRFGGKLRFAISGSAALSQEVANFVDALGIRVYEGYGLTETSPVVSTNYPGHNRCGSVGLPIPGVNVTIDTAHSGDAENGEIIIRGENVMQGYYLQPEETAAVLSVDGAFRTGDLGHLDKDGYLYITGRIKEQYKLETGKYVVPSPLEEQLKLSPFILNVMLHGANRPHNVALIAIDAGALKQWAETERRTLAPDITQDPAVLALITSEIAHYAQDFKSYEAPRALALTTEDFTVENGMLTPSLKLKRRKVLEKYGERLEALY